MSHVHSVLRAFALTALLTACAVAGTAPANAPARSTPPRMVSRGPLELSTPGDLRIEVLVKADGRPDLRTLKITGSGDRVAVERWINSSVFEPARRGDVPIDAVYRTRLTVEVRRM